MQRSCSGERDAGEGVTTRSDRSCERAVAALVISAAAGILAQTAPQELACQFVGVSANETGGTCPTAIEAAAAFAADLSGDDPGLIGSNRGVIDVTGSVTLEGEPIGDMVFAIRDHGPSVGFLHVDRDDGGWAVGTVERC
jgi:hypothetical protein